MINECRDSAMSCMQGRRWSSKNWPWRHRVSYHSRGRPSDTVVSTILGWRDVIVYRDLLSPSTRPRVVRRLSPVWIAVHVTSLSQLQYQLDCLQYYCPHAVARVVSKRQTRDDHVGDPSYAMLMTSRSSFPSGRISVPCSPTRRLHCLRGALCYVTSGMGEKSAVSLYASWCAATQCDGARNFGRCMLVSCCWRHSVWRHLYRMHMHLVNRHSALSWTNVFLNHGACT